MAAIFISHPFASDREGNSSQVRVIARGMALRGHLPLAPHLFLPQFIDEPTERELALRICLRLVAMAEEVYVYGETSEGMRLEIAEAERLGIPVVYMGKTDETADNRPDYSGRKVERDVT